AASVPRQPSRGKDLRKCLTNMAHLICPRGSASIAGTIRRRSCVGLIVKRRREAIRLAHGGRIFQTAIRKDDPRRRRCFVGPRYTNSTNPQDVKVESTVTNVGIEPVIFRQPNSAVLESGR